MGSGSGMTMAWIGELGVGNVQIATTNQNRIGKQRGISIRIHGTEATTARTAAR